MGKVWLRSDPIPMGEGQAVKRLIILKWLSGNEKQYKFLRAFFIVTLERQAGKYQCTE
jgi:hypothetical protein